MRLVTTPPRGALRRRFVGPAIVGLLVTAPACGGKVVYDGDGSGIGGGDAIAGNAAGTPTGGSENVDLEPVCDKFCAAYQSCAPVTQCKLGCMSSAVLACKKEYAADVACITDHLKGCSGFSQACEAEQQAYEACQAAP